MDTPVNRATETRVEARVTRTAICLLNGLDKADSYFDSRLTNASTVTGSSYSVRGGRVQRHDFVLTTPVQRTSSGSLRHSPIPLPGMASTSTSDSTILNSTAEGI